MVHLEDAEAGMPQSTLRIGAGGLTIEATGSNDYVSAVFNELKGAILGLIQSMPPDSVLTTPGAAAVASEVPSVKGRPSLRDFYQRCRPSAEHRRVTVFAYYRKHYGAGTPLNENDAERMYNEVGEKLPNVGAALSNAARKDRGWLKRIGRKQYEITGAGENWVKTTFSID